MIWTHLSKFRGLGPLVLRVATGLYLAFGHGLGKIVGGPEQWAGLGGTMEMFGLGFFPTFWGFMAAFAEFFGALFVAVGFVTRPAALLVVINMLVAATSHILGGDGFVGPESAEMALLYATVFCGLIFTGPGPYSIDDQL